MSDVSADVQESFWVSKVQMKRPQSETVERMRYAAQLTSEQRERMNEQSEESKGDVVQYQVLGNILQ